MVKDHKFAQFYLLLKIHERLENVPGQILFQIVDSIQKTFRFFFYFHL